MEHAFVHAIVGIKNVDQMVVVEFVEHVGMESDVPMGMGVVYKLSDHQKMVMAPKIPMSP